MGNKDESIDAFDGELSEDSFFDHTLRVPIQEEIHARLIPPLQAPLRARRIVFLVGRQADQMAYVSAQLHGWCGEVGIEPPDKNWRQFSFSNERYDVTWEAHTEFVTLTWYAPINDKSARPKGIGLEVLKQFPIITAARIDVVERKEISPSALLGFEPKSLCLSRVGVGNAQIGTDFQTDENGFTRFEIAIHQLSSIKTGILVRRLLEIDTYRTMALVGLADARIQSRIVGGLETELSALNEEIGCVSSIEDSKRIMGMLHSLSVRAGQSLDATAYRFAASQAYGDVLQIRLDRIEEEQSEKHTTITRYLSNRVDPALATCRATEKRQRSLNNKIARSIQLLDARINVDMQSQSREVLSSISETAKSQYKLQSTVEGLSTIAISYYSLGILGYVLAGFADYLPVSKTMMLGLLAPFVLLASWFGIQAIKNRHRAD
ncbi:DUF3422 domain-containing protein [Maritalea porphyrae]|jgi:uncharacterized membrane-anchored protein|uniref:DUF3422 domain-containing protein n=1 Tax=Maritalea porphyrae TaxID=880732 RepID=UPI0022B056E8|nr:DUF3422 domain-containing protein [Maritalea porphyrae]MCZ4273272.1 DUF3422 domain-containing protein [Maritalea porphyrae]